jgi:hypothetical protein
MGNKNVEGVKKKENERKTDERLSSKNRDRKKERKRERVFRAWGAVLACLGQGKRFF